MGGKNGKNLYVHISLSLREMSQILRVLKTHESDSQGQDSESWRRPLVTLWSSKQGSGGVGLALCTSLQTWTNSPQAQVPSPTDGGCAMESLGRLHQWLGTTSKRASRKGRSRMKRNEMAHYFTLAKGHH